MKARTKITIVNNECVIRHTQIQNKPINAVRRIYTDLAKSVIGPEDILLRAKFYSSVAMSSRPL